MGGTARVDGRDVVSAEDFAAVFAALPTAYLVRSPDLTIVEANPAYLALLGRPRDELIGRYVSDAFPPAPDTLDPAGDNPLQPAVGSQAEAEAWAPEMREAVEQSGQSSWIVVPLAVGGRPLGALVAGYTNGLVERSGSDLDARVDRLERLAAELVHLPLEELCDQLLDRLVDGHPADDVALVAVRTGGART